MDTQLQTTDPASFLDMGQINTTLKVANEFFRAKCFGADVQNAQQAFVKIQAGLEMGMAPMESMNSLYIVNGKITIWGSAMTKRLRERGWKIEYKDEVDGEKVTVVITKPTYTVGQRHAIMAPKPEDVKHETHEYTATKRELVKLNSRAFKFAPKDKLRWHAISRLVRFNVPEILGGVITYSKEEAEDFKPAKVSVVDTKTDEDVNDLFDDLFKRLEDVKTIDEFKTICSEITKQYQYLSLDQIQSIKTKAKEKKEELNKAVVEAEPAPEPEEKPEPQPSGGKPIKEIEEEEPSPKSNHSPSQEVAAENCAHLSS